MPARAGGRGGLVAVRFAQDEPQDEADEDAAEDGAGVDEREDGTGIGGDGGDFADGRIGVGFDGAGAACVGGGLRMAGSISARWNLGRSLYDTDTP